jgi:hypothetical protein
MCPHSSAEPIEAILRAELARPELRIYTVVVMAERDLAAGRLDAALARLRVDADKLRCHDTRLNELLASC